MSRASRVLLIVLAAAAVLPARPAQAQRGRLIEELFQTLGEAQLEREQRKRIEAEIAAPRGPLPGQEQMVPLPQDVGRGAAAGAFDGSSITVQTPEAAEFARTLIDFSTVVNSLSVEMRSAATRDPAMRPLLPQAYRLLSQSRTLIALCDGLASLETVVEPYTRLDASWRELSFALDAIGERAGPIHDLRREADRLIAAMDEQLGVSPQFDRRGLRDTMVAAAAHTQSLIDDLELAHIGRNAAATLEHDARLIRQRLLDLGDRAETAEYEETVALLNDFAGVWWEFASRVEPIGDPHLQRRLDRFRQDLSHAYALLRMTPQDPRGLQAAAGRLSRGSAVLIDQLSLRSVLSLPRQQQAETLNLAASVYDRSVAIEELTESNVGIDRIREEFLRLDRDWAVLRGRVASLPTVRGDTVQEVEAASQELRNMLGLAGNVPSTAEPDTLIQSAAALELYAQTLHAELAKHAPSLRPAEYRASILQASADLAAHTSHLHTDLSSGANLQSLKDEAEFVLESWQRLSADLDQIHARGLLREHGVGLQRNHRHLLPAVAELAAALVE